MSDVYEKRARLAALSRYRSPDDPAVTEAAQAFRAARLEDHIRRIVDEAPPLTDEQRNRLAVLLRGSGAADA